MSRQTSMSAVLVHALLFAGIYTLATHAYSHMKKQWQRRKLMRFARALERQAQTAVLFDIVDMQAEQSEALNAIATSCARPAK